MVLKEPKVCYIDLGLALTNSPEGAEGLLYRHIFFHCFGVRSMVLSLFWEHVFFPLLSLGLGLSCFKYFFHCFLIYAYQARYFIYAYLIYKFQSSNQ
jgi:hypothetical protein